MVRSPHSLRHGIQATRTYVCWSCQQKRGIASTVLRARERAKQQWEQWAKEIRAGQRKTVLQNLDERGLVHDIAGERKALEKLMTQKRVGVYTGIDPTASSLHVGHMLPLMALFWMYVQGCHAVALVGGSTAKIGDPTGRTTSRQPMTPTQRKSNMVSIHYQVKKIWNNVEKVARSYGWEEDIHHPEDRHRELVNNATWWNKLTFVDVVKYLGSGVRIGTMLSRDTVKNKMENGDGMSFAEFCYPLMQAWDWWHMYNTKGIQLQIGGADQYGNIVAGAEGVKHVKKTHPDPDVRVENGVLQELDIPYGFTVPLLTTASGEKFGKSAGNAIWLDEEQTSLFDLYGFFVRTADADVERYLKFFTFMPLNEIQSVMAKHNNDQSKRTAQHKLAFDFVRTVHGDDAAERAMKQHQSLFQKKTISSILQNKEQPTIQPNANQGSEEIEKSGKAVENPETSSNSPNPWTDHNSARKKEASSFENRTLNPYAPVVTHNNALPARTVLPRGLIENQSIAKVLYAAGLVGSRSEGHRLAQNQGAYIGARSGSQMADDLRFIPAKLADPSLTWKSVIRDEEGPHGGMNEEGEEGILILRVGKWKVRVIRVVSDELFRKLVAEGQEVPRMWEEMEAERAVGRWEEEAEQEGSGLEKREWRLMSGVGKGPNESGVIKHRGTSRAYPVAGQKKELGDDFEPHQKIGRSEHRQNAAKQRQESWEYLTSRANDPDGAPDEHDTEPDWVKSLKRGEGALGDGPAKGKGVRGGRKGGVYRDANDPSRGRAAALSGR